MLYPWAWCLRWYLFRYILYRQYYSARITVLFTLGVCGDLLAPLLYNKSDFFYLVLLISDTIPLLFLLFTQALFEDHHRPARGSVIAGALYLCAAYLSTYLPTPAFLSETLVSALWVSSRLLMAAMLAYALYLILRHWREDLVERRRLLRLTVVLIVCGQIVGVVAVETIMGTGVVPQWVEVANSAGIVLSSLIFVSAMVLLGPEQLMRVSVDEPEQLPVADQREVGKIVEVMEHDHIYRDMALTIRGLAVKVDIPEHRLRQRINQQLDYRNFNDFLNHYRIAEVTSRLCDPDSARTPVLTIAMDAGYRSMTTFNKAFKARHSLTPVEYRQKHLPIP